MVNLYFLRRRMGGHQMWRRACRFGQTIQQQMLRKLCHSVAVSPSQLISISKFRLLLLLFVMGHEMSPLCDEFIFLIFTT